MAERLVGRATSGGIRTSPDYSTVTEVGGDDVSRAQVERLCHRYYWAGAYCLGKDVLEVACGTGAGNPPWPLRPTARGRGKPVDRTPQPTFVPVPDTLPAPNALSLSSGLKSRGGRNFKRNRATWVAPSRSV